MIGDKLTLKERLLGRTIKPEAIRTADPGWDQLLWLIGELTTGVKFERIKDVEGAIASSPVASRAVHIIADAISLLPIQIWKGGEPQENPDKELFDLMERPNPDDMAMTRRKFLEQIMIDYMTHGRIGIMRDIGKASKKVRAFVRLAAKHITVETTTKQKTFNAFHPPIKAIKYNNQELPLEQIIYLYNWTARSEYMGESPLQSALDSAAGNAAMVRASRSLFEKNGLPSVQMLLQQGFNISAERQNELVKEWRTRYNDPGNRGGIVSPPPGIKFEPLQVTNKDAEYSLALEFNNKAIAIAAGIPWIILMAGDATYENQDAAKAFMWNSTILPLCKRLEEAFTLFIARTYGDDLEIRFDYADVEELLRKVQKAATAAGQAIGLKLNEIRGLYPGDYPPVDKGDDLIYMPGGFKNLENIGVMPDFDGGNNNTDDSSNDNLDDSSDGNNADDERGLFGKMAKARRERKELQEARQTNDKEKLRQIAVGRSEFRLQEDGTKLVKEIQRLWRKQRGMINAALAKQSLDNDLMRIQPVKQWINWDDEQKRFMAGIRSLVKKLMIRAGAEFMIGLGNSGKDGGFKFTSKMNNELNKQVLKFAKTSIDTTIKYLELAIQKSKQEEVRAYILQAPEYRQEEGEELPKKDTSKERFFALFVGLYLIAEGSASQREGEMNAHWASEYGNFEAGQQAGYGYKTWVNAGDDRVRDSHIRLDNETVPINGRFSNGLNYPGDPNGAPEEIYNCRCTVIFSETE